MGHGILLSSPYLQPPSSIELQIADEGIEIDNHMRVVALPSQEDLLPKSIPTHQRDDLHTYFSPLNQNTLA